MDDDERNALILAADWKFSESSKLYKSPGHKSNATDLGMWKLEKEWPANDCKSRIYVFKCPLAGRLVVGVK